MSAIYGYLMLASLVGNPAVDAHVDTLKQAGANGGVFQDIALPVDRPSFQRMLAVARQGDTIYAVSLDHLGNSPAILAETLQAIRDAGLNLRVIEGQIDSCNLEHAAMLDAFTRYCRDVNTLPTMRVADGGDGGGDGE